MLARLAGSSLALLAFAVSISAGLIAGNAVTVVLSRSLLALFIFLLIGLILGAIAQRVVDDHREQRQAQVEKRFRDTSAPPAGAGGPAQRAIDPAAATSKGSST
jgi:uncharacterized protein (DUF58 family)